MSEKYENRTFENKLIQLDGNQYISCIFQSCTLQYGGFGDVKLEGCQFNKCSWSFISAAARTVQFMSSLYHGAGEGGKDLIEKTFNNIREGRLPPKKEGNDNE